MNFGGTQLCNLIGLKIFLYKDEISLNYLESQE